MCFDIDSMPPIFDRPATICSATSLILTSADRTSFSAFLAAPKQPDGKGVIVLPRHAWSAPASMSNWPWGSPDRVSHSARHRLLRPHCWFRSAAMRNFRSWNTLYELPGKLGRRHHRPRPITLRARDGGNCPHRAGTWILFRRPSGILSLRPHALNWQASLVSTERPASIPTVRRVPRSTLRTWPLRFWRYSEAPDHGIPPGDVTALRPTPSLSLESNMKLLLIRARRTASSISNTRNMRRPAATAWNRVLAFIATH